MSPQHFSVLFLFGETFCNVPNCWFGRIFAGFDYIILQNLPNLPTNVCLHLAMAHSIGSIHTML